MHFAHGEDYSYKPDKMERKLSFNIVYDKFQKTENRLVISTVQITPNNKFEVNFEKNGVLKIYSGQISLDHTTIVLTSQKNGIYCYSVAVQLNFGISQGKDENYVYNQSFLFNVESNENGIIALNEIKH